MTTGSTPRRKTATTGPKSWATPAAVTAAARKQWDNGAILRELNLPAGAWTTFPLRVRLPGPTAAELVEHRTEAQAWSRSLRDAATTIHETSTATEDDLPAASAANSRQEPEVPQAGWALATKRVRAGVLGMQTIPAAAYIATPAAALGLLGRQHATQSATFQTLFAATVTLGPVGTDIALRRPFDVLDAGDQWPLLIAFAHWLIENPRPGIYVRQVPLPGLHTKVVEQHRAVLTRLLDAVLPTSVTDTAIDETRSDFAGRFGFIAEARSVRIRGDRTMLGLPPQGAETAAHHDPLASLGRHNGVSHTPQAGPSVALVHPTLNVPLTDHSLGDVTWPVTALAALDAPRAGVREVVVVENKTSFLTTPHMPGRLVLWGAGYGADELLAALPWRFQVAVTYWGDLDTHGLHILDAVRGTTTHVRSVLMDLATFEAHKRFWTTEARPWTAPLERLTEGETLLHRVLYTGRAPALRLEQEFITYNHVAKAFAGTLPAEEFGTVQAPNRSS
jgi:hypothetical protein